MKTNLFIYFDILLQKTATFKNKFVILIVDISTVMLDTKYDKLQILKVNEHLFGLSKQLV